MQLASYGSKATARFTSKVVSHPPNGRSIHIPRGPPFQPSAAQRIVNQSKNILFRFVTHLTAPGLHASGTSAGSTFTRAAHTSGRAAIQNGFSFPVRVALSRPFAAPALPRAPRAPPRGMTQVGLGTARNFHSSRPLFQNLAENIPVAGRAFYEADWDVKMRAEKENMRKFIKEKTSSKKAKKTKSPSKATLPSSLLQKEQVKVSELVIEAELDHYFPAPAMPAVTTTLLIPLAPTPSARMPLSPTSTRNPILPLHALYDIHNDHSTHSMRVSSLFSRLDAANVWNRGVQCSAYAHGTIGEDVLKDGVDATCTVLKVEFVGWTKQEVRGVIGESGSGWCVLEEIRDEEEESLLSAMGSEADLSEPFPEVDDASSPSFVFPTLDFSSSFSSSVSSPPSSLSEYSDSLPSSPGSGGFDFVDPPSTNGYFGFSSSFAERWDHLERHEYEPTETMF